jgi:hypothetical protein
MSEDDKKKLEASRVFEARLKKILRIDPRYSILDFQLKRNFLHIFTDSLEDAVRVSRVYRKMFPDSSCSTDASLKIKVVLLPDNSVGYLRSGICHVGVAPVRSSGASSSEQVTQVLYGESFDALQIRREWTRLRLHADGYIGWVSSNQVTLFAENEFENFRSLPKVFVRKKMLALLEKPNSHPLREAVFGSQLAVVGSDGDFLRVRLPDGPLAYAEKSGVSSSSIKKFSTRNLLATARGFQGASYVWGGRSAKGFDCSGFVQTVFHLNGVELPRDTVDQFSAGRFIGKNFKRMRRGDLLFFSSNGNKINHVGIFLGHNKEFIHSSGFVGINSLDWRRKNFSERLLSNFVGACRVIS